MFHKGPGDGNTESQHKQRTFSSPHHESLTRRVFCCILLKMIIICCTSCFSLYPPAITLVDSCDGVGDGWFGVLWDDRKASFSNETSARVKLHEAQRKRTFVPGKTQRPSYLWKGNWSLEAQRQEQTPHPACKTCTVSGVIFTLDWCEWKPWRVNVSFTSVYSREYVLDERNTVSSLTDLHHVTYL